MDMRKALDSIEARAAQAIKREEGDYEKDGVLYCGKCDTPKQIILDLFGDTRKPFCLCKCAAEKRAEEERQMQHNQRMLQVQNMRRSGFPDADMQHWNFENDDHKNMKVIDIAKRYVENFPNMKRVGKGLLFYGNVGTGKTFAAACIANALIDTGEPCLVTNFARLVNTLQGMYDGKQEYLDSLNNYSLLVIDDLASERDTEYMGEIVQNIIDSRYRANLPLIITTNLTAEELKNPAEIRKKRIYSRLFEMCIPVHVEGKDRRRQKLKADYDEYKTLLGLTDESEHQ